MKNPRRLAFFLPDMRVGGAEKVALRLIRDFSVKGYEVDLLLMQPIGLLLEQLPPGVNVVDLRADRIRSAVLPLRRYFRDRQPAAMQISMWPLTVAAVIAHRLSGSRARLVLSDHIALSRQYAHFGLTRRMLLRWSIGFFYPLADARIVVSEDAANDLARVSGVPRASIEVIYNPVAKPNRSPVENDAGELWGTAKRRILSVGSLKDQKNHLLLIRSFAQLGARASARLIILGDGELRPSLEAAIASAGLEESILLPGFRDPWPFYESADLFVLSSDYEGFGLVIVEALRCGLTVVSTDCEAGPREILDGGRYGYLVPVDDEAALTAAMEGALERPLDPETLKARAEAISGQSTSDRYLELMTAAPREPQR
jgi:glycosyltransferase involved in cell wall biosynthesis